MGLYLVELQLAGISSERLDAVSAALNEACQRLALSGTTVTFLRGTFVPDTGRCLCLFEAASPTTVRLANELAQLPLVRIETVKEVPT